MKATLASLARTCARSKDSDTRSTAPKSNFTPSSRLSAPTVASKARCATPHPMSQATPSSVIVIPSAAHAHQTVSHSDHSKHAAHSKPAVTHSKPARRYKVTTDPTKYVSRSKRDACGHRTRYGRSHSRPGPVKFNSAARSEWFSERARQEATDLHEQVSRYPDQSPVKASRWTRVKASVCHLVKGKGKSLSSSTVQASGGPTAKKAGQETKAKSLVTKALTVCGITRKPKDVESSEPRKPTVSALKKLGAAPKPGRTVRTGVFQIDEFKAYYTRNQSWQPDEKTKRGEDQDPDTGKPL